MTAEELFKTKMEMNRNYHHYISVMRELQLEIGTDSDRERFKDAVRCSSLGVQKFIAQMDRTNAKRHAGRYDRCE